MNQRIDWTMLFVAAALGLVAAVIDLPKTFGAHPWWSGQVAWVGAIVGVIIASLAMALRVSRIIWIIAMVLLIAAIFAVAYGKAQFAASYAEDAFAGRLWYFGWFDIVGGAVVATALWRQARAA